jgi:2,3-dihydroxybiphenyl 1,2-dioxygenase
MSAVIGLGYIGLAVKDVGAWEAFARDTLGLQLVRNELGSLSLRMDDRAQRIFVEAGPQDDLVVAGWEVSDASALDAIGRRLVAGGYAVTNESKESAAARRVQQLIACTNPNGIRTEIFWGADLAGEAFSSQQVKSRFVTGKNGMGHFVELAKSRAKTTDFYQQCLGLKTTDFVTAGIGELTFLHCNGRHHSVAFVELPAPPKHIHHFMLEVAEMDDVGFAYERRERAGIPLMMDLGRHTNDKTFSFYMRSPSGFAVEVGWGAAVVDDAVWTVRHYDSGSLWGHGRTHAGVPT